MVKSILNKLYNVCTSNCYNVPQVTILFKIVFLRLMQDYIVIYYCLRCCVENNKNRNNFVKQWHKE